MADSITVVSTEECCGCRACADICRIGAISFHEDKEGFFLPHVDETKCVSCGRCLDVCPINNPVRHSRPESCLASQAINLKERDAGSSGGIFGLLSILALSDGYVVYGAAFNDLLKLRHQSARSLEELTPLLKSKYIQSDLTGVFKVIRDQIKNGERVVFCGTPCQCNALQNVLGNDNESLLTIDFVCHGVPSQHLFDKVITWYEHKNKVIVKDFQFRYKGKGVKHPQSYRIVSEDLRGRVKETIGLHYQFPYYFAFQTHISLRRSCYTCQWACPGRCSDITLGDFWGIDKLDLGLVANEGVSLVVTNTNKGRQWIDRLISGGLINAKSVAYSFAVENNGCLSSPTEIPTARASFFSDMCSKSFDEVVSKYMTSKKRFVFDMYYAIPKPLRKIVRKMMENRMKYE